MEAPFATFKMVWFILRNREIYIRERERERERSACMYMGQLSMYLQVAFKISAEEGRQRKPPIYKGHPVPENRASMASAK